VDFAHSLLIAWTCLIFYVLGQIWFAQIVVDPLFGKVGEGEYIEYHGFYGRRIPLPVIVPGFASFLLPLRLAFLGRDSVPTWLYVANAACALVGLLVTVAQEIPRHVRLEKGGRQPEVIRELVRFNWPRTLSITGSAVLLTVAMLIAAFGSGWRRVAPAAACGSGVPKPTILHNRVVRGRFAVLEAA
jgi:hypothetical protein